MNSGHGLDRIASTGVDMARRRGTLRSNRKIGIKDKRRIKKISIKRLSCLRGAGGPLLHRKSAQTTLSS